MFILGTACYLKNQYSVTGKTEVSFPALSFPNIIACFLAYKQPMLCPKSHLNNIKHRARFFLPLWKLSDGISGHRPSDLGTAEGRGDRSRSGRSSEATNSSTKRKRTRCGSQRAAGGRGTRRCRARTDSARSAARRSRRGTAAPRPLWRRHPAALTWAMPAPMRPPPMTVTCLTISFLAAAVTAVAEEAARTKGRVAKAMAMAKARGAEPGAFRLRGRAGRGPRSAPESGCPGLKRSAPGRACPCAERGPGAQQRWG